MDCQKIHPLLSDKTDGVLAPEHVEHVEAHLAECEQCRTVLRELDRIKALTACLTGATTSPQFMGNLRREVRVLGHIEETRPGPVRELWEWILGPSWSEAPVRRLAAAAALALILLAGAWIGFPRSPAALPATPSFELAGADDSYYYLVVEGHRSAEQTLPFHGDGCIPMTDYQDTW